MTFKAYYKAIALKQNKTPVFNLLYTYFLLN